LVTGGVLEHNPALSVKAPRQKLGTWASDPQLLRSAYRNGDFPDSRCNGWVSAWPERSILDLHLFTSCVQLHLVELALALGQAIAQGRLTASHLPAFAGFLRDLQHSPQHS
jgi:hypothetical protein